MKLRLFAFALAIAVAACIVVANAQTPTPPPPALRFISPKAGEKVSTSFVTVRWQLLNPTAAAAGTPNFELRLDGQDAVHTSDTEFTFNGLSAGRHTLLLQLVDANGTAIGGAHAEVTFTIANPAPTSTDTAPDHSDIVHAASLTPPPPLSAPDAALVSRI